MSGEEVLPSAPTTMRAWTHSVAGPPPKVLTLSPTHPTPTLTSPSSVLVRISHAALNPGGSIMMQLCPAYFRAKPAIPELDFAGTIVAAGDAIPASRQLEPGVKVFGSVLVDQHIKAGSGALAEYVVVEAKAVVRMPEKVSFEKAAGLAVSGCTAVVAVDDAGLKEGDVVLVNGASGGVGSMVVQLAKNAVGKSGKVVAVCSGSNLEMVKKLGADEVIDYKSNAPIHKFLATGYSKTPFNVVIDAYGVQDVFLYCADYLERGKPFVSVGVANAYYTMPSMLYATFLMFKNSFLPPILGGVDRPYKCVQGFVTLPLMQRVAELVEAGKLDVPVDSCWEMGDALKAYDRMLSKRAKGKIFVKVQD